MAGSTTGVLFRVTTFGESHGEAIGAVIDGCPAGLPLSASDIAPFLARRRTGAQKGTSMRKEEDAVRILSGLFEGRTTGTPILLLIENKDPHSADYDALAHVYRPGHADFTYDAKYGFRDYRGGGRSSGRETAARVCAGAVALKFLREFGIGIEACLLAVGGADVSEKDAVLEEAMKKKDSLGGIISCTVRGLPAGLGEPVFDKLDAELAKAILSVGAVKGIEFGDGFSAAASRGSRNNDPMRMDGKKVTFSSNHAGGVLGGMSSGADLTFRTAFKPTPSIAVEQKTVTSDGKDTDLIIKGRHDACIALRAPVVVEAMTALVLADALLRNMASRLDGVRDFYRPEREDENGK